MVERVIVRRRGDALYPDSPADTATLRKFDTGKPLAADLKQPRNLPLHKKAFSLAALAFHFWEPENFVSATERLTVRKLAQFLVRSGLDRDTMRTLARAFLRELNQRRTGMEMEKSFEAFRSFITIEAGYYTVTIGPAGPRKEARSWSFASMDDTEFQAFYSALFDACWRHVLGQTFSSPEEAEAAAYELMTYE